MKSRGAYETPGVHSYDCSQVSETLTLDRETAHYKQQVSLKYAEMVYYGQWFCQLREALDAFIDVTQQNVTAVRGLAFQGTLHGCRREESVRVQAHHQVDRGGLLVRCHPRLHLQADRRGLPVYQGD